MSREINQKRLSFSLGSGEGLLVIKVAWYAVWYLKQVTVQHHFSGGRGCFAACGTSQAKLLRGDWRQVAA